MHMYRGDNCEFLYGPKVSEGFRCSNHLTKEKKRTKQSLKNLRKRSTRSFFRFSSFLLIRACKFYGSEKQKKNKDETGKEAKNKN